jgi:hypothetical protein
MFDNIDKDDPEKHLKTLLMSISLSERIRKMALARRQSLKAETREEKRERLLVCIFFMPQES